jgi:Fe-S-cluster-containing dehydrogenase component/anaerobic selenocysteine-containing dehydrogenase
METKNENKRYWMQLEELNPAVWNSEESVTRRGQEFYDKPIDTLEKIEALDKSGVTRRDFLTIMGASMAMASFACARRPVNKIIPYVVQPQELTPGVPLFYASTLRGFGADGYGLLVKTREGRPIKLEGNDEHPMNNGKLSGRAQAALLSLYDPDRLKAPLKGSKGGSKSSSSWSEVDAVVADALKNSKKVRVVSYPASGESVRRAMKEFLSAFNDGKWLEVDPLGMDEVADGQSESFGTRVVPHYAFDKADVVVSFGADFLGTWGSSVENASLWSKRRKLSAKGDHYSKLYVFESNLSTTGASSDERFALIPGAEVAAALAVAHELIVVQKRGKFAGNSDVTSVLNGSVEEWLSKSGSLSPEKVKQVANDLWAARGKSLVVGSGSIALQTVVNLLNASLENDGKTVDGTALPLPYTASTRALANLQSEMEAGQVDVLIMHQSNPVYFLPNSEAFAAAMQKVKLVVSINDRVDETANFADVVLPENHFLESWGDAHPKAFVHSLQQPTLAPIFDTRSFEDILIFWTRAGVKTSGLLAQVAANPKGSFYDYLKENWKQNIYPAQGKGQNLLDFWETSLQKGVVEVKVSASHERAFHAGSLKLAKDAAANLKNLSLGKTKKGPATVGSGIALGLYESVAMGDGQYANNAWLQEMPDPMTTITWDNFLNISPAYAQELNLVTNDVVTVKLTDDSSANSPHFEIPVNVQPGIAKGVGTIALGYGRTSVGKVGNNVGQNAFRFAHFSGDKGLEFNGISVTIANTGKKYDLAMTQGHHRTEGRPILNEVTIGEYQKDPNASMETEPAIKMATVPSMWTSPFDYSKEPYRWKMAVDLNTCTGCGACVIACQAENNVPVVGRDRVRQSREMHWIRIDRYYSGDENTPTVAFQPMMCQHCENAPCETVCPVVATSHSPDGLNQMTYSRCVGTRYCQNNCPYKVRRFNFFDHWKDYKDTLNMVWNPDVTVRSRGIMEKCTFCVQRINEAKGIAKDKKTMIKDGDVRTACQQTCPVDAIVFGNTNEQNSAINRWSENPRVFRAMEVLNTRPSVNYLTKVRNVVALNEVGTESNGGEAHGHS